MINVIVTFKLSKPITLDAAREIFQSTASRYLDLPGLICKHYLRSEDGSTVGGSYFWKSRADAEALYTDVWRDFVRGKYGTDPVLTWYEVPITVDNGGGGIIVSD